MTAYHPLSTVRQFSIVRRIIETVQDELGVEVGDTTADGFFTLFTVACLGCCSLAPVMMVDEETHGRLTAASVRKILRGYRRRAAASSAGPASSAPGAAAGARPADARAGAAPA